MFGLIKNEARFLKNWARNPLTTGAIAPSGKALAQKMASFVPLQSPLPVLEIGAGTGSVTKALLDAGLSPEKLIALEYSDTFCRHLEVNFPTIRLIQGDAYSLSETLEKHIGKECQFSAIISSLPLLTRPKQDRVSLLEQALHHLPNKGPFIQFSYGLKAPVEAPANCDMHKTNWILKNIPPARVFVYR